MKKYMFIEFNRYDGHYSQVTNCEFEEMSVDVVKEFMKDHFELDEEDGEIDKWNPIVQKGKIICQDCDETSYMMIEI